MSLVVEQDEAANPGNVAFLGAIGIVLDPNGFSNLVKKFFWAFLHEE
jgi:hypothetical protein